MIGGSASVVILSGNEILCTTVCAVHDRVCCIKVIPTYERRYMREKAAEAQAITARPYCHSQYGNYTFSKWQILAVRGKNANLEKKMHCFTRTSNATSVHTCRPLHLSYLSADGEVRFMLRRGSSGCGASSPS